MASQGYNAKRCMFLDRSFRYIWLKIVQLARAGFFYQPTSEAEDNCECFLCHVKLDGWEDGDDPIEEHLKHSSTCGWAISASIQRKFDQGATVDADPLSEELIEARTHTFGDRWPHESKKGWKPKIKKVGQLEVADMDNC